MLRPQPRPTLFPYTTLFRSASRCSSARFKRIETSSPASRGARCSHASASRYAPDAAWGRPSCASSWAVPRRRSEEHTSELQSHHDLVCRLLLEKKKRKYILT